MFCALLLDLNDARNPVHREAGIYHFTPSVSDINSQYQEFNYQLGGLDDINTENPRVIDTFKQVYGYWLNEVGVDAFRIDTVKYVDHPFWREFLHGPQGIKAQARDRGKEHFLTLGEIKLVSEPLQARGEEKIAAFLGTQRQPELDTVFAFPLQEELNRVFAAGRPTQWLAHRLETQMSRYGDPFLLANFVDNHDVPRFISGGSTSGLKQALALIFTIPGIPVIYQGNEQGAHDSRQAMFDGGYLGQKGGSFDTHSEMFRFIQALTKLRREHKTLIHGQFEMLASDTIGPGVLAYKRSRQGQDYYVIFNSAEHSSLLNNLPTGLPGNSQLDTVFSHGLPHREWQTDAQGGLTAVLPARAILVLKATGKQGKTSGNNLVELVIDQNIEIKPLTRDKALTGRVSSPDAELQLVIDGNLQQARSIRADHQGRWQTTLAVRDLGTHQHRLEVYAPGLNKAAPAQFYTSDVSQPEITLTKSDPRGDDHGRLGNVGLPTEKTFKGQLDLVSVEVRSAGSVLELTINMNQLTDMWIASNGFDHVCLSLFIDVPGQSGLNYLPELQASLPLGQEWDFAHVAYGWGNYLYTTQGAEPGHAGTKIAGAPQISVDKDKGQIRFVYSSLPFGIDNWQGVNFYISTWDRSGEGGLRTLSPEGGAWEFKGPDVTAPLIMDEMMFTLPLEE